VLDELDAVAVVVEAAVAAIDRVVDQRLRMRIRVAVVAVAAHQQHPRRQLRADVASPFGIPEPVAVLVWVCDRTRARLVDAIALRDRALARFQLDQR
jgi:hypothetical protein